MKNVVTRVGIRFISEGLTRCLEFVDHKMYFIVNELANYRIFVEYFFILKIIIFHVLLILNFK